MSPDEFYHLNDDELCLAKEKRGNKNKLGFAVQLKYFQLEGHHPKNMKVIDPYMLSCIANQLAINSSAISHFDFEGRSTERFRQEIRDIAGYKLATLSDIEALSAWLHKEVFPLGVRRAEQIEHAYTYFSQNKIEPYTSRELSRYIGSAHKKFEDNLFSTVNDALSIKTKNKIDDLLLEDDILEEEDGEDESVLSPKINIKFNDLKKSTPGARLKHVNKALAKIECLHQLNLPTDLLSQYSEKIIKKYCQRVMAEIPSSMKDYVPKIRYATFAIFGYYRSKILLDELVDLFLKLLHQIKLNAESYIDKKISSEVKKVGGKFDILCQISSVALLHPKGIIEEKIYPEVDSETLANIVKEFNSKGRWYDKQVQTKMRSLYSHANRKLILTLLNSLSFKTNSKDSQQLLNAIALIQKHKNEKDICYTNNTAMPTDGIISSKWQDAVIDTSSFSNNKSIKKINRFNYELAVFEELQKQVTCKMIWIEGAYRYRDPNEDLPKDFDDNREYYYKLLGLPLDVHEFISQRKTKLKSTLEEFNNNIPSNKKVKITKRNGGHIKITPYKAQADPVNIKQLHREIKKEWPVINLIDVLKEAELDIGLTDVFHTVASRECLPEEALRFRLLLCLYALGTNTGLKAISAANTEASESNLRYVKRKFINVDAVRQAIVKVINKTLKIRDSRFFGEATTSVSCDSKKISVWDQNLLAEWHARYKGRGVMVYWHVEKKALCVYSQLKTCSSSEVGSMLKGVLHHCSEMEIDSAYVDTHGQSTLAFGVSDLLGFSLLPRLKNISKQKLYFSSIHDKDNYENLSLIIKEPIKWNYIENYYDEAVKNIVALKLGTMEPDVFVKRFSKDNYQHPVFKAIIEIGKVSKTNFICRYLSEEDLRIEVHESQNVVERLNSIMGFISYGKLGEISSNHKEEQELTIVTMHLLQACMSYINTVIFQTVLSRQEWQDKLTPEDKRALSLLFHSHINPYGLFPLDLQKRMNFGLSKRDQKAKDTVKAGASEEISEELLNEVY